MDLPAAAAILIAYVIKGLAGFANTLVFSTIMSFSRANIAISPVELVVGYPSNAYIAFRERKHLSVRIWLPLTILVISGSIPGVYLLKYLDVALLKKLFGAVVAFIGLEMLFRERTRGKSQVSKFILGLTGFASGLLSGMFGIGALLAAYINRVTDHPGEFKANLCMVFFFENTLRLLLYTKNGILSLIPINRTYNGFQYNTDAQCRAASRPDR